MIRCIPIPIHVGASSDVEVATKIARTMVTKYAMSEAVSGYLYTYAYLHMHLWLLYSIMSYVVSEIF